MEAAKGERKALRTIFTKAAEKFKAVTADTASTDLELNAAFKSLASKFGRLQDLNEKICALGKESSVGWKEEDFEKEFENSEIYVDKMAEMEAHYDGVMAKLQHLHEEGTEGKRKTVSTSSYKLPQLELRVFDVTPENWLPFWAQYKRIFDDGKLSTSDKFQYLIMSLEAGSRARNIVEAYPHEEGNLKRAVDQLKQRFGREELIIEVYTRKILALVMSKEKLPLSSLYDKLRSYLMVLEALGTTLDKCAFMLYPMVESCLPVRVLQDWERYRLRNGVPFQGSETQVSSEKNVNPLEDLMTFLEREVQSQERVQMAQQQPPDGAKIATASTLLLEGKRVVECIFCGKAHASHACFGAQKMSLSERENIVRRKACFRCLKPGHSVKFCKAAIKCKKCNRQHYDIMCQKQESTTTTTASATTMHVGGESPKRIHLKTMLVKVRTINKSKVIRVLVDDGSQRSFITKDVVSKLNLKAVGTEHIVHGLFGAVETPSTVHHNYELRVQGVDGGEEVTITALDQEIICSSIPRPTVRQDTKMLAELQKRGVQLSDLGEGEPPIEMLIGADAIGRILTGRIEILPGGVSAIQTKLGWCVVGGSSKKVASMVTMSLNVFSIPQLWELETLGISDPVVPKGKEVDIENAITHFNSTVKKNEEGRYEVSLPWVAGHPPLNDNLDVAGSRLESTIKKLEKEGLLAKYDAVFKQWEQEGVIEEVEAVDDKEEFRHYLPHRPVIKMERASSKIRPVFDASVKKAGNASLNDCLSTGPNLIKKIPPLLVKFRKGKFGVTADIKQAFLQMSIRPEDRDVLRFLWRDVESKKLRVLRHCRVVFGVSSSPFLLNATLAHHLDQELKRSKEHEGTVEMLKESFYVDDCVTSFQTEEDLIQFVDQAQKIMKNGKFELCKWTSNAPKVRDDVTTPSVLGILWDLEKDELYCKGMVLEKKTLTKRNLLSVVSQVYDVIGHLSPALLIPKMLLQEAWKTGEDWDDPLRDEITERFEKWRQTLGFIEECRIPRQLAVEEFTIERTSIHVFCDASSKAMGVGVFVRQEGKEAVSVQLVAAKARVAPSEPTTIPRLELLAACLAVRLWESLRSSFPQQIKTVFWTDSTVALCWITRAELWGTYVGNRVKEIRAASSVEQWRHVPGEINPADLPSRGCDFQDLKLSRWWEGPFWLKRPETEWPNNDNLKMEEEALKEMKPGVTKKKQVINLVELAVEESFVDRLTNYFSSFLKQLRLCAWMLRFFNNVQARLEKKEVFKGTLTEVELRRAEVVLWKLIQQKWKPEERKKVEETVPLVTKEDGLLRVKSRLVQGADEEEFQTPVVLYDDPVVRKLIRHVHSTLQHAGVLTTLTKLRESYWLVKGRKIVKSELNKCLVCKKQSARPAGAASGPLPVERLERVAAFQIAGCDLAGPVALKEGKAWIVLFTCAVYRCVHLEVVTSLSTEAFCRALRRFFARRGRSSVMYSDCGTNFVGLSNTLKELDWKTIEEDTSVMRLEWRHIPPASPWWGGWWERLFGVLKPLLRKVLGKAFLSYEEFFTVLCDCEAVLNARPLTYIYDDPKELRPLTPAQFLNDLPGGDNPDLDKIDAEFSLSRIRYVQQVRTHLRERFKMEYLGELVHSRNKKGETIKVGDVVLVGADGTKRIDWPLAQVVELFNGRDGVQRVARLKLAHGELIRPVQRLYPLELKGESLAVAKEEEETPPPLLEQPIPEILGHDDDTGMDPQGGSSRTRHGRTVRPPMRLDL